MMKILFRTQLGQNEISEQNRNAVIFYRYLHEEKYSVITNFSDSQFFFLKF